MAASPMDRVLSCPNLPSLPSAAVTVLELTRDPNVTLDRIAQAIQTDPAIATKVLRTVNSSYYGLSRPCATIGRAMGFLGLTTVKSVVLGFSLVDSSKRATAKGGFDLAAYWRRAVFAAAGARLVAETTGLCDRDEAFLGALVQDIGMLAAFAALGEEYAQVTAAAGPDHDRLCAVELEALQFTHAEAGTQLAVKWRMPDQLVACIRYHHDPDQAPPESETMTRVVALGTSIAAALDADEPGDKLRQVADRAKRWFSIQGEAVRDLLEQTAQRGSELARAMDVKTGEPPDIASIMAAANEQLFENQMQTQREAQTLRHTAEELTRQTHTDALTGAHNRKHLNERLADLFANARSSGSALGVLFMDADKFKSVNDIHGHEAGDAVLIALVSRIRAAVIDGEVCRYGGEEFVVLLPGATRAMARDAGEAVRLAVEAAPIDIFRPDGSAASLPVTISVGVSAIEPGDGGRYPTSQALVSAADQAVYAAKRAGRNRVFVARDEDAPIPTGDAVPPDHADAFTILLVEDDPLVARLLEMVFRKKSRSAYIVVANSAERAIELLGAGVGAPGRMPSLIVSDYVLPGLNGFDLLKEVKADARTASVPVVVLAATNDAAVFEPCLHAGAAACIGKSEMAADFDGCVRRILAAAAPVPSIQVAA